MKRSTSIYIPLLLSIAGCSPERAVNPCDRDSYDDKQCQTAVSHGGFYYKGTWHAQTYNQPSTYYASQAHAFVAGGGVAHPAPDAEYSPSYSRGVFGSSGEDAAAGHGGGEGGGGGEGRAGE